MRSLIIIATDDKGGLRFFGPYKSPAYAKLMADELRGVTSLTVNVVPLEPLGIAALAVEHPRQ